MIKKVANMTINDSGDDVNRLNMSYIQVQFTGNPASSYQQKLLVSHKIGIRHEEVPLLDPHN